MDYGEITEATNKMTQEQFYKFITAICGTYLSQKHVAHRVRAEETIAVACGCKCSRCSIQVNKDDKFCPQCGAMFREENNVE